MLTRRLPLVVVLLVVVALVAAVPPHSTAASRAAHPLAGSLNGTAFTYQGTLATSSGVLTGTCDFRFVLYDAEIGGSQIGPILTPPAVNVSQGHFTVLLDFGAVFDGNARWLEVAVKCPSGSGTFTTLAPRQRLTPTPYALRALLTDDRYWNVTGNGGTTPTSNFLGTTDNQPLIVKVNNATVVQLQPTGGTPNLIGGYGGNTVTAGVVGATIGGGGGPTGGDVMPNVVTDDYGTIGGGSNNQAGDNAGTTSNASYDTVGGGTSNQATGNSATVGGGSSNQAAAVDATVGGGNANQATGNSATVSGGAGNQASGDYATVPGGLFNVAAGQSSVVSGNRAKNTDSTHAGVFLFADSTGVDFPSTRANEFAARATGGFRFQTSSSGTVTGCTIPPGGGSITCTSDRNAKNNIVAVDPETMLERVAGLPISSWNYKTQDAHIQHIGPMAQDFAATFGVGDNDRSISMVDGTGVALAAIQGLEHRNAALQAELTTLHAEVRDLKQNLATGRTIAPTTPGMTLFQILLLAVLAVLALVLSVLGGIVVFRRPRRA